MTSGRAAVHSMLGDSVALPLGAEDLALLGFSTGERPPGWYWGDLRPGYYQTLLSDCPWKFKVWSNKGEGRSAEKHYKTMSLKDIMALPVADLAARDCGLMMWTTREHFEQTCRVIKAWGFTFSTVAFTWIKLNPRAPSMVFTESDLHMGMGYISRANEEFVIFARRGKPHRWDHVLRKLEEQTEETKTRIRAARSVRSVIIAPRGKHSAKPIDCQVRIEKLYPGPYAYLFSRTTRAGWDNFGDEVGKLDPVTHA